MGWGSAIRQPDPVEQPVFARPAFEPSKIDFSKVVTIDFETAFDDDYTLKKMSTSEYVRDERFKIHMMGIKIGNRKRRVVPGRLVAQELAKIDWSSHGLLCHNTAFDGLILSHHFGVVPCLYLDTLSMARGLHSNDIGASLDEVARYYGIGNKIPDVLDQSKGLRELPPALYKQMAEYCGVDVDLTIELLRLMAPNFPHSELRLVHLTINMFCNPVLKVDIPRVQAEYEREVREREELLLSAVDLSQYDPKELLKGKERELAGKERDMLMVKRIIGSSERFAALLRAEGVEPPVKISPAWIKKKPAERRDEDKWAYAFAKDDADFIELPSRIEEISRDLDLDNKDDVAKLAKRQERLKMLVECRLAVKSTTNITRAERFLKAGANGWSLPVGLSYARAHTLRWGGNNKMNMQNLQRGGELRQSILAPKSHVVCVQDSGQIEARVNAWLWGQDDLLQAFRNADSDPEGKVFRDAYCLFGDDIYGREITKADKMERFVSKVCVLGLGFQMGAPKLQATLAKGALGGPPVYFELNHCKMIVNTYRRRNYRIEQGWRICTQIIEDMAAGRTGSWKCLSWEKETIWMPNGLSLKYPNLKKATNPDTGYDEWTYEATSQDKTRIKKIYGGLLCENIVQCLARIIVAEQMLAISENYRVVMMTHDEIVTVAPKRSANKCIREMNRIMRTPPAWCPDLPLNAEGGYDIRYSK